MEQYPTYLIHYGIPGQKWGVRRFQNEDGTWTSEGLERRRQEYIKSTQETAKKVAGIISGHYSDKNLNSKEMRKLINKYKKYEYMQDENGEYSDKWKELVRKNNLHADSDGSPEGEKLYEWRKFEDRIVKDPSDLYKEKAIRKDRLKDAFKLSDEEAETKLSDINKKIETYNGAVYEYLSSSDMKKTMKELKIEVKDIYDPTKYMTEEYTPEEAAKILGFKFKKPTSFEVRPRVYNPKQSQQSVQERLNDFRKKYGY